VETIIQFDNTLKVDREFVVNPDGLHKFTLEPTDIVHIDGKRYRMVDRKAEVGEKVLVVKGHGWYSDKVGEIFTVIDSEYYGFNFTQTHVDYEPSRECLSFVQRGHYRVLEPVTDDIVTVDESQASPEVIDLLANLARRVTSLERTVRTLGTAYRIRETSRLDSIETQLRDTQGNVERLAQELAEVKHLAESNEADIAVLDERTNVKSENEEIAERLAESLAQFVRRVRI
jgi:hypothetical protein